MPYFGVDEVKANNSIKDVMRSYGVRINSKGYCCCPFHGEKTPSMKIYPNNTAHCFGCNADVDVIDFVQKMESCDFKTAYRLLGGTDRELTPEEKRQYAREKAEREKRLRQVERIKEQIFQFENAEACLSRQIYALPDHREQWADGFWGELKKLEEWRLKCQIRLCELREKLKL